MRRLVFAIFAIAWALGMPAAAQIVDVPLDDKVMEAAIAKARATLPAFWGRVEKTRSGESGHSVKLAFPKPTGNHEHIWADSPSRSGDQVNAMISVVPRDLIDVKKGQRVTVSQSTISDWLYWRDGKMHGAYTLRAVLSRMTQEDADKWRAKLAPE